MRREAQFPGMAFVGALGWAIVRDPKHVLGNRSRCGVAVCALAGSVSPITVIALLSNTSRRNEFPLCFTMGLQYAPIVGFYATGIIGEPVHGLPGYVELIPGLTGPLYGTWRFTRVLSAKFVHFPKIELFGESDDQAFPV